MYVGKYFWPHIVSKSKMHLNQFKKIEYPVRFYWIDTRRINGYDKIERKSGMESFDSRFYEIAIIHHQYARHLWSINVQKGT